MLKLCKMSADRWGREMRRSILVGLLTLIAMVVAPAIDGGEAMQMRVSPAVSVAPALLTVRINLESAEDNRALQVVAESADFYRSSEITLNGSNTNRLNVFEFRNLPSGVYYVTGVLTGVHGKR